MLKDKIHDIGTSINMVCDITRHQKKVVAIFLRRLMDRESAMSKFRNVYVSTYDDTGALRITIEGNGNKFVDFFIKKNGRYSYRYRANNEIIKGRKLKAQFSKLLELLKI